MKNLVVVLAAFVSAANFWTLKTKNGEDAVKSVHFWVNLICLIAIQTAWALLEG